MKRALKMLAVLVPVLLGVRALEWATGTDLTFCAGLATGLVLGLWDRAA